MENKQFVKVWDIAVRVFHWTLIGCYAIAFISSENSQKLHVIFGYSVLFLVLFRIFYGFVGTRYARFSDFLYRPAEIVDYLKGLLIGRPKHYIGHNPAGGFMIVILLLSLLSLTLTGLKAYGVKGHGPLARHEISFMSKAFADDDHYKKRYRYRGGSPKVDDGNNGHLQPVANQTYKETCAECHFAFQPELLPSASWLKILNQLDDHFGEEIEADSDTIKNISDYLRTNGAESSSAKLSVKIMRSLGNQLPLRVTDIPYIRRKHHELNQTVFKHESVGSLANCIACHTTAEKGIYDDDDVKIPK